MPSATSLRKSMEADGFLLLHGLAIDTPSLEIAAEVGVVDEVQGLSAVQSLIPRDKSESSPNTYSGNFGLSEFPLHTDLAHWALPPRYVLLRCLHGQATVSTRLLDGRSIIRSLGAVRLRSALVQPRDTAPHKRAR